MRVGRIIDWEVNVFPAWQRAAGGVVRPSSDVWGVLPPGVCWFEGRVEADDIARLYVIGSGDWKDVFGTYRLAAVAAASYAEDDEHRHRSRIESIRTAIARGERFEPISLVAFSGHGPFVVIDGNHRAVAMERLGLLVGQMVFLGCHRRMGDEFVWFRQALED